MVYLIWSPLELLSLAIIPILIIFVDGLPSKNLFPWNYDTSNWVAFWVVLVFTMLIEVYILGQSIINLSWVAKKLTESPDIDDGAYPKTIFIDRDAPFKPESFIGNGWFVVRKDESLFLITELLLTKGNYVEVQCNEIKGEQRLDFVQRMKANHLDALILETLWNDKSLIPEDWKKYLNGIAFYGTVLVRDNGRYILYLQWKNEEWIWGYQDLDGTCTRAIIKVNNFKVDKFF